MGYGNSFAMPGLILVGLFWYMGSIMVNITWKRAVKVFPYVLPLTLAQFAIGELITSLVSLVMSKSRIQAENNAAVPLNKYLPIGIAFAVGQLCTNASLAIASVSLTHIVKITEPCIALFLEVFVLRNKIPLRSVFYMVVLLAGVAITCVSDTGFSYNGMMFAGLSNIALQTRNVFVKLRKDDPGFGKDGLDIFMYSNRIGLLFLLLLTALQGLLNDKKWVVNGVMAKHFVIPGICFVLQHIASIIILRNISITIHALLNVLKRVLIILIGSALLGANLTSHQIIGIGVAAVGFYLYTKSVCEEKNKLLMNNDKIQNIMTGRFDIKDMLKKLGIFVVVAATILHVVGYAVHNAPHINNMIRQKVHNQYPQTPITFIWARTSKLPKSAVLLVKNIVEVNTDQKIFVHCGTADCYDAFSVLGDVGITVKHLNVLDMTRDTSIHPWVRKFPLMRVLSGPNFETHLQTAVSLGSMWKTGGIHIDLMLPVRNYTEFIQQLNRLEENACYFYEESKQVGVCNLHRRSGFINNLMLAFATDYKRMTEHELTDWPINFSFSDTLQKAYNQCSQDGLQNLCPSNATHIFRYTIGLSPKPPFLKRRFALLRYDTHNLGDQVQSLAAAHFLPQVHALIPRDHNPPGTRGITFPCSTSCQEHAKGHFTMLVNAFWPLEGRLLGHMPNISPIMVSIHLERGEHIYIKGYSKRVNATIKKNIKMLLDNGPVGTRDSETYRYFTELNIPAIFTGCMTLFIKNHFNEIPRSNLSYIIDVPDVKHAVKQHIPEDLIQEISHEEKYERNVLKRFINADKYLEMYAQAKVVITSRLHVALPCVALGTPVIVIFDGKNPRFSGLTDLVHFVDTAKLKKHEITEYLDRFNWTSPPPNPNPELRKHLTQKAWLILRKIEEFRDIRSMFNLRP